MRAQRSGLIITISSTAGIQGGEFVTAYAASKFGVEGWMKSLAPEVAPFGIRTMLVEPGFFRTELLTPDSTKYADASIADYAERTEQTVTVEEHERPAGRRPGETRRRAGPLAGQDEPPLRFPAGADAVTTFENRARTAAGAATRTASCPATLTTTTPEPMPQSYETSDPPPAGRPHLLNLGSVPSAARHTAVPAVSIHTESRTDHDLLERRRPCGDRREQELVEISPFREDGITYGTPTQVWPLVVDGGVYVRAANGQQSSWYTAALSQKAARIQVSGKTYEVTFNTEARRSPRPSTPPTR